jgi:hypothetical protein
LASRRQRCADIAQREAGETLVEDAFHLGHRAVGNLLAHLDEDRAHAPCAQREDEQQALVRQTAHLEPLENGVIEPWT